MRGRVGLFFVTALVWSSVCLAQGQFTGEVVGVADGDTISVLRDGRAVRVRLQGVDCPENAQDFGTKAKQFTSSKVFGKTVTIMPRDIDRYGRTVATVMVDGEDLGLALVRAGLAWHYTRYSTMLSSLARKRLHVQQSAGSGVTSDPFPLGSIVDLPPWQVLRDPFTATPEAWCSTEQGARITTVRTARGCSPHGRKGWRLDFDRPETA